MKKVSKKVVRKAKVFTKKSKSSTKKSKALKLIKKQIVKAKVKITKATAKKIPLYQDECIEAFWNIVKEVQGGKYIFSEGQKDMGKYLVVHEADRGGSSFIFIVPKEQYRNFVNMQKKIGDTFLGFSMLCGKNGNKDLRVSCFGIPTNDITRALLKS